VTGAVTANGAPRARHTSNSPGTTLGGGDRPHQAGGNRFPRKGEQTTIALAARGIRKSFGRRHVLTDLDLEVAAGELVAVAGENGTAKTTLPRILAADLRPDAGTVAIGGRPGYCPQTLLDEALTVWAVRGQYTCWAHGGASPQARARSEFRPWRDRFWARAGHDIARGMQEYDARLRADPDAVRAQAPARLSQPNQRLRQFRRMHGRRPRRSEPAGILNSIGL
jgi:ATPase subunit of ABC transporter with duplicated ATPase domains